jgi:hypothetical protein
VDPSILPRVTPHAYVGAKRLSKACALFAAGLVLLCAREADAGGPLGAQGSRIQTSRYTVDLFQGPVLATTRITGLGGAFTAIAEGTEGIPFNPATASLRPPYSTTRDDYDLTAGLTLPSSVTGTDFDNNGKVGFTYDKFVWLTFGGLLQHDRLGFGLIAAFQNYEIGVPGAPVPLPDSNEVIASVTARLLRVEPVVSYGFLDDQLHLGAGLRFTGFYGIGNTGVPGEKAENERLLINSNTAGFQLGGLWAPHDLPLRVGGAARSPQISVLNDEGRIRANADGDRVVGNIFLPGRVELPWEVEGGVAVQLWKRPFNIAWADEDKVPHADSERWRQTKNGQQEPYSRGARRLLKARYAEIPRQRVLLSFSALVSGPVKNAVGVESMLSQTIDRSGERTVVTVRGGAEAEVIPTWLVLRAGSYLEPTRYRGGEARLHATGGFDLRVLRSSVFGLYDDNTLFRISVAVDGARDYFGWSIGAGLLR